MKNSKYIGYLTSAFVVVLIISNLLSSAKIIDLGFNILGIQMIFDAGLLLFPLCYICGDILTEVYGYTESRKVIWTGFAASVFFSLMIYLAGLLPGENEWRSYAGSQAYDSILGGIASGGIMIASLCAYFFGEFSNSFILAKMKILTKGKALWSRTIGSTIIGQLLDTAIFILIATWFSVFPVSIVFSLIVTNYIIKLWIEILFTPLTYMIVNVLKKVDKTDFYDTKTNFNPFAFFQHGETKTY